MGYHVYNGEPSNGSEKNKMYVYLSTYMSRKERERNKHVNILILKEPGYTVYENSFLQLFCKSKIMPK